MHAIHSRLNKSETVYERFSISRQEAHVVLRLRDADKDFGYLRSAVGATLSSLLAEPYLEFEPIALVSELLHIIGHASKASDAIVKIDVNIYGPRSAATQVGDALSAGKLWLQKSSHMRGGLMYDNPHFLRIKTNGIQLHPTEPVRPLRSDGFTSRRNREERLRKLVEEVYSSLHRNRQFDAADAGDRVVQKLLRFQSYLFGSSIGAMYTDLETGIKKKRWASCSREKAATSMSGFVCGSPLSSKTVKKGKQVTGRCRSNE